MHLAFVLLRYAWASPATAVGGALALTAMCSGATAQRVDGILEISGGRLPRLMLHAPACARFVAITLGHVIIATDHAVLAGVRAHEQVHVRQYERWGVLFFPLYAASSVMQLLRRRRPYLDNHFERQAYAAASELPPRGHGGAR